MPRESAAAKSVVSIDATVPVRISPRSTLGKDVADLFREIVASKPAMHFRPGDETLLELYCSAVVMARRSSADIEARGPVLESGKINMHVVSFERSSKVASALAARLRLAPQLRFTKETAGKPDKPGDVLSRLNGVDQDEQTEEGEDRLNG